MNNEEFFNRIGGTQIDLDPNESSLTDGMILIKLNAMPYVTWLRKLKNIMDESLRTFNTDADDKITNPLSQTHDLAIVVPNDSQNSDEYNKILIVGSINLTYKYLNKMLLTFSTYDPEVFQYVKGQYNKIEKSDLMDTIQVELRGDIYGIN